MQPQISVLLSTFNGEKFIEESVNSVLSQDLDDFELLIIDDKSTDNTLEYLEGVKDPRIRLHANDENLGLYANFNTLVRKSRAPLLKLWSQDDIMSSKCLRLGQKFYSTHSDVGYIYVNSDYLDQKGNIAPPSRDETPIILSPAQADLYCFMHGNLSANISNLFIPRTTFDRIGNFNENYISADFDYLVRSHQHFPTGRIPEILVTIRQHPGQWSMAEESIFPFLSEDILTYETLKKRLVYDHRTMTEEEANKILHRKFGANYFHAAVKHISSGNFRPGVRIITTLRESLPITPLFVQWALSMPRRIIKRA